MANLLIAFIFILSFPFIHSINSTACPERCQCFYADSKIASQLGPVKTGLVANCDRIMIPKLKRTIEALPKDLQTLIVTRSGLLKLNGLCCFNDLEYLDASFNELDSIFVYHPFNKVTFLNLKGNNLTVLRKDEFSSFPSLVSLNLENNHITSIHLETFRLFKLKQLYLGHNQLSTINEHIFRFIPKLEMLKLNGNKLVSVRASNYYFSSRLKYLDLSHNRIVKLDHDGLAALYRLKTLDLSHNNLSLVPTLSLTMLSNPKTIILAANPFQILQAGSFKDISADYIDVSRCSQLRMVLSDAFKELNNLNSVNLSANPHLQHLSPAAFHGTNIKTLDLTNCALDTIPLEIMSKDKLTEIHVQGNPLHCGCMHNMLKKLDSKHKTKIKSDAGVRCQIDQSKGYADLFAWNSGHCPPEAILGVQPDLTKSIGAPLELYCVSRSGDPLTWTLPENRLVTPAEHVDGRVAVTNEYLRFDFLLPSDEGVYKCTVTQGEQSDVKRIILRVFTPPMTLYVIEAGSHYVTLAWNSTLDVQSDKVHFFLIYKELSDLPVLPRIVQLSPASHWRSYTVTRLRAMTNFTFCLRYNYDWNQTLYESCVESRTDEALGLGATLNYTFAAILGISVFFLCAICCARCVHKRFHIWQEEKYRSRLAQSLSGQSFLSSADSLNGAAVTFENMQLSSSIYENLTSRRSRDPPGPIRDMAL